MGRRRIWMEGASAVALLALGLVVRWPVFVNAETLLSSDSAFNALAMKHWLAGDAFFLHYPGQNYQGITEGLLGIALTRLLGWSALSYQLGALVIYFAGLLALYAAVRVARGPGTALAALAIGALGSPSVVRYSLIAVGGHTSVAAAGAGLLACALRYDRDRAPWAWCAGWLLAGLAYYTYRLSVVVIAPVAFYVVYRSGLLRLLLRPRELCASAWGLRRLAVMGGACLLLGLAPLIVSHVWFPPDPGPSSLTPAGSGAWLAHLKLHGLGSVPRLFGMCLPQGEGRADPYSRAFLGGALLTVLAAAVLARAVVRAVRQDLRAVVALKGERLSMETLLLFLAAPFGAAVLSSFSLDSTAVRYLLPMVFPFAGLVAISLSDAAELLRRRWRVRGVLGGACTVVLAIYAVENFRSYAGNGWVEAAPWRVNRVDTVHRQALDYLQAHGIRSAYGTYWVAYNLTFLSNEAVVVAPYLGIGERKPPDYGSVVGRQPDPAYLFLAADRDLRREFKAGLRERGLPFAEQSFQCRGTRLSVYHSVGVPFPSDMGAAVPGRSNP